MEAFRASVLHAIAEARKPKKVVVVTGEPITGVDTTAADMSAELDNAAHESGMDLRFALMKKPVNGLTIYWRRFVAGCCPNPFFLMIFKAPGSLEIIQFSRSN